MRGLFPDLSPRSGRAGLSTLPGVVLLFAGALAPLRTCGSGPVYRHRSVAHFLVR